MSARPRISLEMSEKEKQDILTHGKELGAKSIIGAFRLMLARSKALYSRENSRTGHSCDP